MTVAKQVGVVKRYNRPRGFGFIQTHDGDVFLHDSDFLDPMPVRVGMRVVFDVAPGNAGKGPRAVNVREAA